MNDYIAAERLKKLIETPFPRDTGEPGFLGLQIDHVGHIMNHLTGYGYMFEDRPQNFLNHEHWKKLKPYMDSPQVHKDWMWLAAQFEEEAKEGFAAIPTARTRLMFSVFHYLMDENKHGGKHYQQVIEKTFEVLDLGEVMPESELLANVNQISTLATTVRKSHGQTF